MAFDANAASAKLRQLQQDKQGGKNAEALLEAEQRQKAQEAVEDRAGELVVILEDQVNRLEGLNSDEFGVEADQLKAQIEQALHALGSTAVDEPASGKSKRFLARALVKVKEIDQNSRVK